MKRLSVLLAAFLLLTSFFVSSMPKSALAAVEADIKMSAQSSPEVLSESGLVDVTVLITPSYGIASPESGLGITILSVEFEGRNKTPSSYAYIGATKAVMLEDIYIDSKDLGEKLPVTLTYIDLDRQVKTAKCDLVIGSTAPDASFSRSIGKTSGSPGDIIEIEYTVKNRSGVDFSNISVTDGFIGEIFTLASLKANESHTQTVTYELTNDVVSRPTLTYYYDGSDEKQEKTLDAKAIYVDGAALALELKSDVLTIMQGGTASLTLSVKNDTDEKLRDITFYSLAWLEFDPIKELAPGEVRVFHKDVKLYSDSDISIAAAVTDNDGKQHFCLCRTLSINVVDTNEQKDANTPGLDISAQAVTNGADTALAIEIHNYAEEIFDAVISDENIGVVEEIGDLPLGDSLFTLQREFMQDITLELTLSGKALDGSSMTAKANTITIEPEPIVIPDVSQDEKNKKFNVDDYPLPPKNSGSSWIYLFAAIVCLGISIVAAILLVIQIRILIKRHKRAKQKGK
ncbi:MAG: hypothetical protein E7334_02230 [Clostridiales bacterium]|nr:hypothetical protein [Clostridiales bacterium]